MARLRSALAALGLLLIIAIPLAVLVDRVFFRSSGAPAGTGSGVAATQARNVPSFTGVDLVGDNNVIVRVGPQQSVVVHADDNLLGRVTTRVRANRLLIGTTPGDVTSRSPMFVTVSVPSLDGVRLTGDGDISVTGIDSPALAVALPGSGNVEVAGTTTKLGVTLSGDGNAFLHRLVARDARAALSGDGSIMLTATHSLAAELTGSGTILYAGDPPHVTQRVTGSGTVGPG